MAQAEAGIRLLSHGAGEANQKSKAQAVAEAAPRAQRHQSKAPGHAYQPARAHWWYTPQESQVETTQWH